MSGRLGELRISEHDHRNARQIQLRNPGAGHSIVGDCARGDAVLLQELDDHGQHSHVERTVPGDTGDRARISRGHRHRHRIFAGLADPAILQVGDNRLYRAQDLPGPVTVNNPALFVFGREREPFDDDSIIVIDQSAIGEKRLRLGERLIGIIREDALIKAFRGRQCRPVAEQNIEKLERFDVAAQNHKAQRERGRKDQPDRSPNPCPEHRGHNHRHRRKPGRMAVKQGLYDIANDGFDHAEQKQHINHGRPARIDRCTKRHWRNGGEERADIRDEAQQPRQHSPHRWRGDANRPQSQRDNHAEAGVDRQLRQEVAAEALHGIVYGERGAMKVG